MEGTDLIRKIVREEFELLRKEFEDKQNTQFIDGTAETVQPVSEVAPVEKTDT